MISMLPVVFMAGPVRRPPPTAAEIAAERAAAERGRLRGIAEIAEKRAAKEHTAKTNRMARIESRLLRLKEAAERIVRQMHREILGPELGQTAHGQKKGFFGGRLWADKSKHLEAKTISSDEAKKRAVLAKADAKKHIMEHNTLVDELNRIATELGYDPANLRRHIIFDDLVDLIVEQDKGKYSQPPYDKLHVDFEVMKRRLKNL